MEHMLAGDDNGSGTGAGSVDESILWFIKCVCYRSRKHEAHNKNSVEAAWRPRPPGSDGHTLYPIPREGRHRHTGHAGVREKLPRSLEQGGLPDFLGAMVGQDWDVAPQHPPDAHRRAESEMLSVLLGKAAVPLIGFRDKDAARG